MGTLNDHDLLALLSEAGDAFAVPEDGPVLVLDAHEKASTVVPLHRRRWLQASSAAAAVALGAVLGVALFGGNDVDRVGQLAGAARNGPESTGRDTDFRVESGGIPLVRDEAAPLLSDGFSPVGPGRAAAPAPVAAAPTTGKGAPTAAVAAPAPAAPTADGARVVKTGAIALVVEDDRVTPTLTEVQGFAKAVGGLVAGAQTQELGPTPSGSVTLRVPVDAFEQVVAQVRGLDAEVRSATTSGQDVTAQYADLEAQLRTLTAARERFLEILTRADTIGDVLAVQQRVDDVTGRIDRLEGQRQVLAAQSDSATLEVTVTEAGDPVVQAQEPDSGLSKAFSDAGTGFTSGVEALVRLSGRALLLLLLAVAAYAVLRAGWRVSRRRLV